MKKLAIALVFLIISAITLSSASYAWFSMNRVVAATGMEVQAIASSSLVIAEDLGTTGVGTSVTVKFTDEKSVLTPVTHDAAALYTTGLKYLTNPEIINTTSGLKESAALTELIFADAINTTEKLYYVDYVVYIAAAGATMVNQDLRVELDKNEIGDIPDMRKAVSADFYLNDSEDTLGAYKGTLNLADLDSAINDTLTSKNTVILLENGSIHENGEPSLTSFLRVTIRIYFDGALLKTPDNPLTLEENESITFINTMDVNTTSLKVAVKFTAQDHAD